MLERFGEKLLALRTLHGLSVRELAKNIGSKSTGSITDMEKGRKKPSRDLLIKIAIYFNVSIDSLVRDDMEITPMDWS